MKKLKLSLDALKVESYETEKDSKDGGTVVGNSLPTLPFCTRFGCVSSECPSVPCTLPQYFCIPEIDA
ncbi:MAG TPA: hypothetical protein VFQ39_12755 [Longimicrobium sp.]|nr:hypothetical protein [Longimicrobium sp.]